MIPNNQYWFSTNSGVNYDTDAALYFAQLSPEPSAAYKNAVNNLIIQLKADGNWTKLDRLFIHATESQQNSQISIVNPLSTPMSVLNSPTHTVNRGWTGDGISGYIDYNYAPSVNGVNFTQNSALVGIYTRLTQAADTSIILGAFQPGTNTALALNYTGFGKLYATNANGQDIFNETTTAGFFTTVRTASNNTNLYLNGSLINSVATASTALQVQSYTSLAFNNNGTPSNFSSNQVSLFVIGSGTINNATLYSAIQTFATAIGFNV